MVELDVLWHFPIQRDRWPFPSSNVIIRLVVFSTVATLAPVWLVLCSSHSHIYRVIRSLQVWAEQSGSGRYSRRMEANGSQEQLPPRNLSVVDHESLQQPSDAKNTGGWITFPFLAGLSASHVLIIFWAPRSMYSVYVRLIWRSGDARAWGGKGRRDEQLRRLPRQEVQRAARRRRADLQHRPRMPQPGPSRRSHHRRRLLWLLPCRRGRHGLLCAGQ